MQVLRHFLLAVQFFTRIPVTGALAAWVGYSPQALRASAAHFPGVGWLVGALAAAVYALLAWALGGSAATPWVAAVFSTIATVLATGAFHEDGLADLADGLGGASTAERALEIMKDSRIGAFGALALVLALAAKLSLLAWLGTHSAMAVLTALGAAHVLSRGWPLLLIARLAHVGDSAHSKSKPLADRIAPRALVAGSLWCLPALVGAGWWLGPAVAAAGTVASLLGALYVGWRLQRRLGGFTGDGLGAAQQVAEIGFYLGTACALAAMQA